MITARLFGLEVIIHCIDILGSDMLYLIASLFEEEFVGGFPRL